MHLIRKGKGIIMMVCFWASLITYAGCDKIDNVEEFNNWLNDIDNGCIVSQSVAGYKISVKYQPAGYLILKQLGNVKKYSKAYVDSLMVRQNKSLTFLMTLGPEKNIDKAQRRNGVMYEGIKDYHEYSERVMNTNFFMDQYIRLYYNKEEITPVLSLIENTYELSENRSFTVVFALKDNVRIENTGDCIFVYDDPYCGMGKLQFRFNGKDISNADDLGFAR